MFLFQLEELDIELNYIKELYELAEEYEIPIAEEDIDNYDVDNIFIMIVLLIQKFLIIFFLQRFSEELTTLRIEFDDIYNDQDNLVDNFVNTIDAQIIDMLQEVEKINIEAQVIIN